MGPSGAQLWQSPRKPNQERHTISPSDSRTRDSSVAKIETLLSRNSLRVRHRAKGTTHRLSGSQTRHQSWRSRQVRIPDSSAHASSRNWLQARQRWPRYESHPAISRSQEYSAHRSLHRAGLKPFPGLLEGLGEIGKSQMALHCGFASLGPICSYDIIAFPIVRVKIALNSGNS